MFDIGWSELLVVGALALIVVGPKDLPKLLHTVGRYVAQARSMARDFQRSMEEAAREADLGDVKELKDTARDLRELGRMRFDAKSGARSPTKPPTPTTPKPNGAAKPAPAPGAPAPEAPGADAPAAAAPSPEPAPQASPSRDA